MEGRRWILNRPDLKKRISKGWGQQNPGVLTKASADKRGLGESGVWRSSLGVPGAAVGAGPRGTPGCIPALGKQAAPEGGRSCGHEEVPKRLGIGILSAFPVLLKLGFDP